MRISPGAACSAQALLLHSYTSGIRAGPSPAWVFVAFQQPATKRALTAGVHRLTGAVPLAWPFQLCAVFGNKMHLQRGWLGMCVLPQLLAAGWERSSGGKGGKKRYREGFGYSCGSEVPPQWGVSRSGCPQVLCLGSGWPWHLLQCLGASLQLSPRAGVRALLALRALWKDAGGMLEQARSLGTLWRSRCPLLRDQLAPHCHTRGTSTGTFLSQPRGVCGGPAPSSARRAARGGETGGVQQLRAHICIAPHQPFIRGEKLHEVLAVGTS